MSWPGTPRTWSVADIVTAAEMNDVRDALKEIWRLVEEKTASTNASISATTSGTANTLHTFSAFTADGVSPVYIEFFAPRIDVANTASIYLEAFDGTSGLGQIGTWTGGVTGSEPVHVVSPTFVPSNASHTFSVRAWTDLATQTIEADVGGARGVMWNMGARLWSKGGA